MYFSDLKAELEAGVLYDLDYRSGFEIDHTLEEGSVTGYWIGEIDAWGKFTFKDAHSPRVFFFFPHDVVAFERTYPIVKG